jgi:damage-control phosphatase, subfamily I
MKIRERCYDCLVGLARQVVSLSGGNGAVLEGSQRIIDALYTPDKSPPEIANQFLRHIRETTGVTDPFAEMKAQEFERARLAAEGFRKLFPPSLEGVLKFAALGNSLDFFADTGYDVNNFRFVADLAAIEEDLSRSSGDALILADNVGEFFFDLSLIRLLEDRGKRVYYAVKERAVQNDLSMPDVEEWGLRSLFGNIVSTGTDEVGMRSEQFQGLVRDLWEGSALVIAKGMGNYETISEFDGGRRLIHILKVKCEPVAEALGRKHGEHTAFIGGDHGS